MDESLLNFQIIKLLCSLPLILLMVFLQCLFFSFSLCHIEIFFFIVELFSLLSMVLDLRVFFMFSYRAFLSLFFYIKFRISFLVLKKLVGGISLHLKISLELLSVWCWIYIFKHECLSMCSCFLLCPSVVYQSFLSIYVLYISCLVYF